MTYLNFPAYTEDITVASSLLADRVSRIYESMLGRDPFDEDDIRRFPGLISKVSKVQLIDRLGSEPNIIGTIHVTTSHVIFKADDTAKEIWIANGLIGLVERGPISALGSPLTVRCKHFLTLTFLISRDKDCQDLFETLTRCGRPVNISEVFAFDNRERGVDHRIGEMRRGWDRFDWHIEFARQGIGTADKQMWKVTDFNVKYQVMCIAVNISEVFAFDNRERGVDHRIGEMRRGWDRFDWHIEFARQGIGTADKQMWKVTDFNVKYQFCDTYPEWICVPAAANKQMLIGSCKFRSRARLPALTYWHRANAAAIARCAQPLTGFSARCVEDEQLMDLIAKTNPSCSTVFLIDTRPKVNAMVNKMQGKGFEDVRNYANMRFHFFDIENIHIMRASLQKLLDACQRARTMSDYLKQLEASGWLRHTRALLECGTFLADSVAKGISCVVHCSDGWDRTSQTVSIAQLLLDPFYRTIRGFQILIEKDWLGFGHKFDDRCGHVGALNEEAAKEVSPIFAQFLDATFQLMRQRPRAFEFNERYLIEIHEHAYSCQYGTFLGNCDKDRKDLHLCKRTQSLWAYLDDRHDDYLNPLYEANKYTILSGIDLHPSTIVVWTAMYNRFDTGLLPRESTTDVTISTLEHIGVLEAHMAALQAKVAELKAASGKQAVPCGAMVDSGHSSGGSSAISSTTPQKPQSCEALNGLCASKETLARQDTQESGIYDSSFAFSEDNTPCPALRWQSLRVAEECSSKSCGAEFATRGERRLHCYRCGKIHCRRCITITSDERERICDSCAAANA
ncbi:Myotubularin-related protein 8 [Toxocara canis]|uniref:phosphatidylinositol-3,5-bisphosphate 3-phosphatase n=1 Tax=Toxocara canis TaxID=6265 RepID=A0A0B2VMK8_TOXCA|nr:Myotubularin-related protein 8 [Toxocara canis]